MRVNTPFFCLYLLGYRTKTQGKESVPAGHCRNTCALKLSHSCLFNSVGVLLCTSPPHTIQGAVEAWSLTCQSQLSRRALIPNYQAGQNHSVCTHTHSHALKPSSLPVPTNFNLSSKSKRVPKCFCFSYLVTPPPPHQLGERMHIFEQSLTVLSYHLAFSSHSPPPFLFLIVENFWRPKIVCFCKGCNLVWENEEQDRREML